MNSNNSWLDFSFMSESIMAGIFENDFGLEQNLARDMAGQVIDLFLSNPELLDELRLAIGE